MMNEGEQYTTKKTVKRQTRHKAKPDYRPWHPYRYTKEEVIALQNVATGQASGHEQKLFFDTVIRIAQTYQLPYVPDSERDSIFLSGMIHVGQQIVKLSKIKVGLLEQIENQLEEQ